MLSFHVQRSERPLSVKEGSMDEKWPIQFCLQHTTSTVSLRIFYMPQIYDMGQTALLYSKGRHAEDFFRPKNPKTSAGFEPANLGTRGQHANH
jgi:hypothetical protein